MSSQPTTQNLELLNSASGHETPSPTAEDSSGPDQAAQTPTQAPAEDVGPPSPASSASTYNFPSQRAEDYTRSAWGSPVSARSSLPSPSPSRSPSPELPEEPTGREALSDAERMARVRVIQAQRQANARELETLGARLEGSFDQVIAALDERDGLLRRRRWLLEEERRLEAEWFECSTC